METKHLDTHLLRVAVDINEYNFPGAQADYTAAQKGQLEFGDLHANGLKLFYALNYHNVLHVNQQDYETVRNIYLNQYLTQQDIEAFDRIIDNAESGDVKALLIFIGDELADRGLNDYFILKIIERLHKAGVKFDILLSNHGLNFLRAFEEGQLDKCTMGTPERPQDGSKVNLAELIKNGIISAERVAELVKENYLPHVKPAAFALDEDNVTFSTHAPVGKDAIEAMAKRLNIKTDDFPADWTEGEQLAAKVEIARELFQCYLQNGLLFDELINYEYEMILGGSNPQRIHTKTNDLSEYIFEYLAWSRQTEFSSEQRPARLTDNRHYATVHGHDSKPSYCGTVYNLDNVLGKGESLHCQNDQYNRYGDSHYTALYLPQQPFNHPQLQAIIQTHVDELKKTLEPKIKEKALITALQQSLNQAEQTRQQWKEDAKQLKDTLSKFEQAKKINEKQNFLDNANILLARLKSLSTTMESVSSQLEEKLNPIPETEKTASIINTTKNYLAEFSKKTIWFGTSLISSARSLSLEKVEKLIAEKQQAVLEMQEAVEKEVEEFELEAKKEPSLDSTPNTISTQPSKNLLSRTTSYLSSYLSSYSVPNASTSEVNSKSLREQHLESKQAQQEQIITKINALEQQEVNELKQTNEKIRIENQQLNAKFTQQAEDIAVARQLEEQARATNIELKQQFNVKPSNLSKKQKNLTAQLEKTNFEKTSPEKEHILEKIHAKQQELQQENTQLIAAEKALPASQIQRTLDTLRNEITNICGSEQEQNSYQYTRRNSNWFKQKFSAGKARTTQIKQLSQLTQGNHSVVQWMNRLHTIKNEIKAEVNLFDSELLKKIDALLEIASRPFTAGLPLPAEVGPLDISLPPTIDNQGENTFSKQQQLDASAIQEEQLKLDEPIIIDNSIEVSKQILEPKLTEKELITKLKLTLNEAVTKIEQWENHSEQLGYLLSEIDCVKRSDYRQRMLNKANELMKTLEQMSPAMDSLGNQLITELKSISDSAENTEIKSNANDHLHKLKQKTVWVGPSFTCVGSAKALSLAEIKELIDKKQQAISEAQEAVEKEVEEFEMEAEPISTTNERLSTQLEQAEAEKALLEQEKNRLVEQFEINSGNQTLRKANQQLRNYLTNPQQSPDQEIIEGMRTEIRHMVGTIEEPAETYQNDRIQKARFSFFKQIFATEPCKSRITQIERLRSLATNEHSPFQFMNELHAIRREIKAETNLFDSELLKKINQIIERTYIIQQQEPSSLLQNNTV